jgi:hypothetical protein
MNFDQSTIALIVGALIAGWVLHKWFASMAEKGSTVALRVAIAAMEQRAKMTKELTASEKAKAAAAVAHDAELLKSLQAMVDGAA